MPKNEEDWREVVFNEVKHLGEITVRRRGVRSPSFVFRSEYSQGCGGSSPLLGTKVKSFEKVVCELVVGVENILDAYDPLFGPKPGRHLTLGLRAWH